MADWDDGMSAGCATSPVVRWRGQHG